MASKSAEPSGRRFGRHAYTLEMEVAFDDQKFAASTTNVGFGGLFINTNNELPVGGLVTLTATLPTATEPLALGARVIRRWPPFGDTVGFGLRLYGNNRKQRSRWMEFIKSLDAK